MAASSRRIRPQQSGQTKRCARPISALRMSRSAMDRPGLELDRKGAAGTIPPPAESAFTRVFDALWRWGGWRGAKGDAPGGGRVDWAVNSQEPPTPAPTPPLRFAPRGEGRPRGRARFKQSGNRP